MGNRLTIVTGASSGIGKAVADEALARGEEVATCSRRPGPGRHLVMDLADPDGWPELARWIDERVNERAWSRVVLVHSAGTLDPIGFAGEVDPASYTASVLLNSAATQIIGDAYLRSMGSMTATGVLMMISSGAGRRASAGWSSYCAGKAATDHWVRAVGAEQDQRGCRIRVLSVVPGVVETEMQARIRSTPERDFPSVQRFVGLHEQGQLADATEVGVRLVDLVDRDDLSNGAVVDLREM
jgi:benzil reductase ((S)-benzoin forming)